MNSINKLSVKTKLTSSFIIIAILSTLINSWEISGSHFLEYILFSTIINVFLAFVFGIIVSKIITKSLSKISFLINEIDKGHLKERIEIFSKDELGRMAEATNQLADDLDKFVVGSMKRISQGDFKFEIPQSDSKSEISPAINGTTRTLQGLKKETDALTKYCIEGKLSERGNLNKFNGGYKEIVQGLNNILDAVVLPIKEGSDVLSVMATGDLTVRVKGEYQGDHQVIKDSINQLGDSLEEIISEVNESVSATASASNEISSSTEEMAAGAEEQSQQTSEVASAVEQMTKTIIETTKNAGDAAESSKKYGEAAQGGGNVVNETIIGMNRISEVVKKSAATVQQLGKSSEQIGEIVQVIDDIADQTNLLALNAAIEAARAGEQGRGFAVVADEVRKLAERTTKATKEIATMIRQIQRDTEGAVVSMEEGTKEVEKEKQLADRAGESLKQIISGAGEVVKIITQVAAASEEQSSASEQISKNIEAISSVTQQSSAGVQQIARAAEDLNRLTVNLENLVGRFKVNINIRKDAIKLANRKDALQNMAHLYKGNGNGKKVH